MNDRTGKQRPHRHERIPRNRVDEHVKLRVKKIPALAPACESGQHRHHPGVACDEAEAFITAWETQIGAYLKSAARTPMADVPPTLRGPNWKEATP